MEMAGTQKAAPRNHDCAPPRAIAVTVPLGRAEQKSCGAAQSPQSGIAPSSPFSPEDHGGRWRRIDAGHGKEGWRLRAGVASSRRFRHPPADLITAG